MKKSDVVKDVLENPDPRTYDKFIKSINDSIYSCSGTKLSLYDSTDCSCFVRIVNEKLMEKYS